ncbi:hypothetical protein E5288_WYG018649 [Bos mutus]|uniref:Uncharacterized protein n=1 Tax=Bos mutus TaxID=72004 RepID=A0A6B0R2Q7_9CETA|nr:hypothetical protein [Bos mutus]
MLKRCLEEPSDVDVAQAGDTPTRSAGMGLSLRHDLETIQRLPLNTAENPVEIDKNKRHIREGRNYCMISHLSSVQVRQGSNRILPKMGNSRHIIFHQSCFQSYQVPTRPAGKWLVTVCECDNLNSKCLHSPQWAQVHQILGLTEAYYWDGITALDLLADAVVECDTPSGHGRDENRVSWETA